MKYLVFVLIAMFVSGCSDSNAVEEAADEIVFVQLSSMDNQVRGEDDLAPGRIFTEIVDEQEGFNLLPLNAVEVLEDGLYSITLSPQSGQAAGCGRYWSAVNDIAIPNSSVQICQSCPTLTSSSASQSTLFLASGDVITFWQSGEVGIQSTVPDDIDEPSVPSVVVTVIKL